MIMPVLYRWEISAPFQDLDRAPPIRIAFSHHIGLLGLLPKVMRHDTAQPLEAALPLNYDSTARVGIIGELPPPGGKGRIVVATGELPDFIPAE